MKDYIERKAAIRAVTGAKLPDVAPDGVPIANGKRSVSDCIRSIKNIPAADVKPVVRGEWIWEENEWQYRCSVCRITFDYDKTYELFDHCNQYASFCPNCGADMRGEN